MHGRRGFVIGTVVLTLLGCSGSAATQAAATRTTQAVAAPRSAFRATVDRVVDGDTFIALRRGERVRVRLIGIDAPESVRPGYPVECWGHEASAMLTRLLPVGTRVSAAYQAGGKRDIYGRDLWDVWLPDGRFVQAVLVRRGAAEAVAYRPQVDHAAVLDHLEAGARRRGAGLWGACGS